MPARMRALILEEPGRISMRSVETPEPGPGELLLRVVAATTCGTDLKAYRRGHPQIPMPGGFGHEYSGVVAAAGDDAPFSVGDEIMGVHSAPCMQCEWCLRGQENLCETIMATKVLGSFAEYLLIPERVAKLNVFAKPGSLPFEVASLLEPLSCVAQGLALTPVRADTKALVIGPGAIGLMFVAALHKSGVSDVSIAGRNPARLEIGRRLGATPLPFESLGSEPRYDLVIECTGAVEVWESSLALVRRGGALVLFGGCAAGTVARFDTRKLHYDQINVLSPFHFGVGAVRQAREWLLDPTFDLRPLLSGDRELEEAAQVFADLAGGEGVKYVFRP